MINHVSSVIMSSVFDKVKYNSAKFYSRIMEGKGHYVAEAANFQLT